MGDKEKLVKLTDLATEALGKGRQLQQMPELNLVGNAYVGMGQRMLAIITAAPPEKEKTSGWD